MVASSLIQKAKFVIVDNADTILTGMGVTGTIATAVLTGRASFKAAQIIQKEQMENEKYDSISDPLSKSHKIKLTWRLYLPAVGVGTTTVTSIIVANRLSGKKIAALAVASGISERALQEYKTKVVEKLSDRQAQAIQDEIAQERVRATPLGSKEIILAGTGDVLCFDMLTGRYFQSNVEDIKRAENKMNHQLLNHMSASLSEFYDEIGLPPTSYTDSVGWGPADRFEVTFSTVLSTDNRPCLAIDFVHPPQLEYSRRYFD